MRKFLTLVAGLLLSPGQALLAAPLDSAAVRDFVGYMVEKHGFEAAALEHTFAQVSRSDRVLELIARPAEKTKPWSEYRAIFITDKRIRDGAAFWHANESALSRAAATYGVAPEVIIAIIGVETSYGQITGGYRVIDALATLAFHYPGHDPARAGFFRTQLEQLLLIARDDHLDPLRLTGSYAGAMGMPQFMPESYRNLAVDFDGDGARDIWTDAVDAIGSVANYLHKNGWRQAGAVTSPAQIGNADPSTFLQSSIKPVYRLADLTAAGITPRERNMHPDEEAALFELDGAGGAEYWIGFTNFYVISRYNPRVKYAMAVAQLSEEIRKLHSGSGS